MQPSPRLLCMCIHVFQNFSQNSKSNTPMYFLLGIPSLQGISLAHIWHYLGELIRGEMCMASVAWLWLVSGPGWGRRPQAWYCMEKQALGAPGLLNPSVTFTPLSLWGQQPALRALSSHPQPTLLLADLFSAIPAGLGIMSGKMDRQCPGWVPHGIKPLPSQRMRGHSSLEPLDLK